MFLSAFRSLERGCAPWSARAWLLAIAEERRPTGPGVSAARAAEGFEPDDVPAAEAPDEAPAGALRRARGRCRRPRAGRSSFTSSAGCGTTRSRRSRSRPWQASRRRSSALVVRFDPPSSTMERSAHEGAAKLLERFVAGKLTRQGAPKRCRRTSCAARSALHWRLHSGLHGCGADCSAGSSRSRASFNVWPRRSSRPPAAASARPGSASSRSRRTSDGPAHGAPAPQPVVDASTSVASGRPEPAAWPAPVAAMPTLPARASTAAPEPRRSTRRRHRTRPRTRGTTGSRRNAPAPPGTRRHTDPAVGVARAGDRHRGNDACYGLAPSRGGAPRRNVASHRCP